MKKTFRLVLALVLAAMMIASMIPAMAATTTITVTINANGGKFADGSTTKTFEVEVDSTATTVNLGLVDNIPNVIASESDKGFNFWATADNATAENLDATINNGAATFYAIWKTISATNNRELDKKISVSGLETGDVVNFYRVLQWDADAVDTLGWVATAGFAYDADTNPNGLKKDEIQKILGLGSDGKPVTITDSNKDQYGISAEMAAKIAKLAGNATYTVNASDGTATKDNPEAGLYLALITPGISGVTYNPVFVSADYNGNGSNFKALDLNGSYNPVSIAKKSKITLEKTASTTEAVNEDGQPETVAAGDTVSFTIETTIPKFAANYTSAKFFVTDTLSKGLELDKDSIKVFEGWVSDSTIADTELSKTFGTENKTAYTVTPTKVDGTNNGQESFKVDFTTDYLLNGMGNLQKNITIKYDAKVTTDAPRSVNLEKNEVTVNYSNNPSDGTGNGKLKDETKHYTFDIDGNILGPNGDSGEGKTPWQTTEVVKVGLDANGNEITQTVTLHGENPTIGWTTPQKIGALEGAKFMLYNAVWDTTDEAFKFEKSDANIYTNDIMKAGYEIRSDATGRLTIYNKNSDNELVAETIPGIRGLDIGTYYLLETEAPAGYIKQQEPVKVEIIAPKKIVDGKQVENDYWKKVSYSETNTDDNNHEVTWDVWELKKYDVKIAGAETASYTFINDKDEATTLGSDTDQPTLGDHVTGAHGPINTSNTDQHQGDGKIVNTQGVELPHTGGIGTTLFYIGGSILVLAAVILLVTKRRMGSED